MGAAFKRQANALFRKSASYQYRSCASNCCLITAPILFCLILFIIQVLINNVLLNGANYKCGCQCLQCCDASGNCAPSSGICTGTCRQTNGSNCAIQYSNAMQAVWCSIEDPPAWPNIQQTPQLQYRAAPAAPNVTNLYTGNDRVTADTLARGLVQAPNITAETLQSVSDYLVAWNAGTASNSPLAIPGEALSLLGLSFGSYVQVTQDLYIEPAFSQDAPAVLVPPGTCAAIGAPIAVNMTLSSLLDLMVSAANPPATAATLKTRIQGLVATAPGAARLLNNNVQCTDTVESYQITTQALESTLYCGYRQAKCSGVTQTNQYLGAVDWHNTGPGVFTPDLYHNDTVTVPDNSGAPPLYARLTGPLDTAFGSWVTNTMGLVKPSLIGVGSLPKPTSKLSLDFGSLLGPLFYTWVVQMLLPIFVMQLVYEKERNLRIMMKMHGLGDGAYWIVTYAWDLMLYIAYMFVFIAFGSAIGLNMFRKNSYGIQIIFYFLWGNCMIAFSFLLSCLFTSSRTATVFSFLVVFGTGLIGYLLLGQLVNSGRSYMIAIELIPSFALYRGLYEFGQYSFLGVYRNDQGMTFKSLSDDGNGMVGTWIIFIVEWFVFMVLSWYLEQTWSSGTGIRRPWLFFLDPIRKRFGGGSSSSRPPVGGDVQHVNVRVTEELEDVALERRRVAELTDYNRTPIVIKDLQKIYPSLNGGPKKIACRHLYLAIERGECFGLLGPNGAGKSTAINMMVGLLDPTAGTAIINGCDIRTDMGKVYERMGVCPQHDLLWDTLTGTEHLLFYGRLKGLEGAALTAAVETGLRSVNLWNGGVAVKQSRQYSGGMKRRLSVAISFIGAPDVVYLDECSTGLDPASRRNLWDVVKASKSERAIVLTTHSMEEATQLCDRLGIFVDGQLVCIGNPKEITNRYGGYFVFTLSVPQSREADAKALVSSMAPNARLTYALGGTLKFELPCEEVTLSQVFSTMQQHKGRLGVLDWGIANATLEEVFIKFARSISVQASELTGAA